MIRPMSPGTIEVVSRSGSVLGNGFVWIDGKEVWQEWVFQPAYEWPPFGVAEFRAAASEYGGLHDWYAARSALWTHGCTFVRGRVERRDEIYPIPPQIGFCAVVSEGQLAGIAFAESKVGQEKAPGAKSSAGALQKPQLEAAAPDALVLFEARETWLTNAAFKPPPLAALRLGPYSADLFAPVGVTRREILDDFGRSDRYTRTLVYCTAYAAIPA